QKAFAFAEERGARPPDENGSLLYVVHGADGGGTGNTTLDLAYRMAESRSVYLLQTYPRCWDFFSIADGCKVPVQSIAFPQAWRATAPMGIERAACFLDFVEQKSIRVAHVRQLLG